jgi:CxxH/CxxC protein (TIGR04129 family)
MEYIYSCLEDYDMAIDDFLIEHETFPIIEKDEDHTCAYCSSPSAYRFSLAKPVEKQQEDMI